MRASLALVGALGAAFTVALPAPAQSDADKLPFAPDRTGLDWVLPFDKARAKAKREQRLLVIKPIAFGTAKDGGW